MYLVLRNFRKEVDTALCSSVGAANYEECGRRDANIILNSSMNMIYMTETYNQYIQFLTLEVAISITSLSHDDLGLLRPS